MSKATERQKDYILYLLEEAGEDETGYISDLTDGQKSSVQDLTFEEASDIVDDLKELLGWEVD